LAIIRYSDEQKNDVFPAPGKDKAKIYDYVDAHVGVLKASAGAR